jgi:hypothetical protein
MAGLYDIEELACREWRWRGKKLSSAHGREDFSGLFSTAWHGYYLGLRAVNLAPYDQAKAFAGPSSEH